MANLVVLEKKVARKSTSRLVIDRNNSLTSQFAKWLYKETCHANGFPNGSIVSAERCALKIQSLRGDKAAVKMFTVRGWISASRVYFENNLNCTIWPIPGRGWRASNKYETAKWGVKTARKTIAWAERCRRIFAIMEDRHTVAALREEMGRARNKILPVANLLEQFSEKYKVVQKEEQKLLAPPPVSKSKSNGGR